MPHVSAPPLETLQVGEGWFPHSAGGLNRYYHELCRHLPAVGVAVRGLTVGSPAVAVESEGRVAAFAEAAAPILDRWRGLRRQLAGALKEAPEALVVAHFALYAFPALDLLGRRPLVIHFHGPWAIEGRVAAGARRARVLPMAIERAVYQRGTRLIVLSEAFRRTLHETYGVPLGRIERVPGGVEAARYDLACSQEEARRQLGWPADRRIVLSVRRLTRRMGLEELVEAASKLKACVPEALVLIAGQGERAASLQAQIQQAGLEDHVRLLGFLPDAMLPLAYRAADLAIVPSNTLEGFGLIVAEALAAGTPTLVTPVGGLPEVVAGLSRDLILPSTGAAAIADGLAAALQGRRDVPDAARCQAFARAHYDWRVVAERLRGVYEEALTG